jgi:beta-glucosidase
MSSYNPVNGVYTSENRTLLRDILRDEWGFSGIVMSDWNSVYSTRGPLEAGMDLEMPAGIFYCRDQIVRLVRAGAVPEALVDEKVRHVLRVCFEMGFYDRKAFDPAFGNGGEAHEAASLQAAREAIVLLKNEGDLLPLQVTRLRRVVVLGAHGRKTPAGGGGAAYVRPTDPVSVEQGLREALPASQVAWVADRRGRLAAAAAAEVRKADAVVVCVGFDHVLESEHYDRSWKLPAGQARLVRAAAALNPNVVVTITAGGDVETASWIGSARAVLHTFFLGSIAGRAVADVLTGAVSPSGKLPFTMARRWRDHPATANYVGAPDRTSRRQMAGPKPRTLVTRMPAEQLEMMRKEHWPVRYEEGIFVGYRGFDARQTQPQFPFGHGLSYTTFALSDARLSSASVSRGQSFAVSVTVRNTGRRRGAEVVQVYVADTQSSLPRPPRELKGFARVELEPGESRQVSVSLGEEDLSYYDPGRKCWVAEAGAFGILVGTSSRAIACELDLQYTG